MTSLKALQRRRRSRGCAASLLNNDQKLFFGERSHNAKMWWTKFNTWVKKGHLKCLLSSYDWPSSKISIKILVAFFRGFPVSAKGAAMGWWWSGGESLGDGRHGPPYMGEKPRWRPENHFQPTSLRPSGHRDHQQKTSTFSDRNLEILEVLKFFSPNTGAERTAKPLLVGPFLAKGCLEGAVSQRYQHDKGVGYGMFVSGTHYIYLVKL